VTGQSGAPKGAEKERPENGRSSIRSPACCAVKSICRRRRAPRRGHIPRRGRISMYTMRIRETGAHTACGRVSLERSARGEGRASRGVHNRAWGHGARRRSKRPGCPFGYGQTDRLLPLFQSRVSAFAVVIPMCVITFCSRKPPRQAPPPAATRPRKWSRGRYPALSRAPHTRGSPRPWGRSRRTTSRSLFFQRRP